MSVTFAQGFSAAGVAAGISAVEGKKDMALVVNNGPLDVVGRRRLPYSRRTVSVRLRCSGPARSLPMAMSKR